MNKKKQIRNNMIRAEITKRRDLGMKVKDAIVIVSDIFFLSSHQIRNIWYFKDNMIKNTKQIQSILCLGLVWLMTNC
jgi:hypothetical protein